MSTIQHLNTTSCSTVTGRTFASWLRDTSILGNNTDTARLDAGHSWSALILLELLQLQLILQISISFIFFKCHYVWSLLLLLFWLWSTLYVISWFITLLSSFHYPKFLQLLLIHSSFLAVGRGCFVTFLGMKDRWRYVQLAWADLSALVERELWLFQVGCWLKKWCWG